MGLQFGGREICPNLSMALPSSACIFSWFSNCLQRVSISVYFRLGLFGIFKARCRKEGTQPVTSNCSI